ncbi:MAG: hypothetical protein M3552_04430 [Planctomycetota bacterium]|nr:hypothetical protein [Planctomycetaceae bacterium]MDQ3329887.1 hypothetical protein [Planctomycetota bacterium]
MLGTTSRCFAAVLVVAASGCAQTGASRNPLAWFKKPSPQQTADAEPAPLKPPKDKVADQEKEAAGKAKVASNDPPAKPDGAPVDSADKKVEGAPPAVAAASNPAEPKRSAGTSHDAETLALIDEELKHASNEERDKLFAEWKSLDGAMVRQVIRIRKMVRELEAASPASSTAVATAPAPLLGSTAPWGGNSAPANADTSRVLPLGSTEAAASSAPPIENSELLAVASSPVQQIGHSVPVSASVAGNVAAGGHSATRPIPVLEALAGGSPASVNGQPASAIAASPENAKWVSQVQNLVAAAEARAEQASTSFLGNSPNSPADDATRRRYVESQVHLRLVYLMAGEQARAMQAIPGLEAADQEFWQQMLWGVANYFDSEALPNRSDRVTQTVEQLRTAVSRLQGEANLQMRNVAFCHKIVSFGNFERFERDEYSPGQRVLLYAELANFKSVPQPSDGLYKTQLKSTIEIFRAGQGQPAKKMEFEPTVDLCRSHRQDYFHSYELKIPADLTLGPHVLKLTVEDVQSGKLATYSVNFAVK